MFRNRSVTEHGPRYWLKLGQVRGTCLCRARHKHGSSPWSNVATAGGCLPSLYIAARIIGRRLGAEALDGVIRAAAAVGEKDVHAARAVATVSPIL